VHLEELAYHITVTAYGELEGGAIPPPPKRKHSEVNPPIASVYGRYCIHEKVTQ